jgi:hypothetical protein
LRENPASAEVLSPEGAFHSGKEPPKEWLWHLNPGLRHAISKSRSFAGIKALPGCVKQPWMALGSKRQ